MTSLLQHNGRISHGRVELILKLQRWFKRSHCAACGVEQSVENAVCVACGVRFVFRFRAGSSHSPLDRPGGEMLVDWSDRKPEDGSHYVTEQWTTEELETGKIIVLPDGSEYRYQQLYRVWRKPLGLFGHFVVFRLNGEDTVPDLSVPISVERLPRDAETLSPDECYAYWTS